MSTKLTGNKRERYVIVQTSTSWSATFLDGRILVDLLSILERAKGRSNCCESLVCSIHDRPEISPHKVSDLP